MVSEKALQNYKKFNRLPQFIFLYRKRRELSYSFHAANINIY